MLTSHEFEVVRAACGGWPIRINSAYRTPAHNARVGGAPRSQHLYGRALDLHCPPQIANVRDFWAIVRRVAMEPGSLIGALGYYATFIHLDTRPRVNSRLVEWHGVPHPAWQGQDL